MALLFMDGFDHYGNAANPISFNKWAGTTNNNPSTSSTQARTGTYSLECSNYLYGAFTKTFTTSGGFVVGVAVYFTGTNNQNEFIIIREGSTDHLYLSMDASAKLRVVRGGTTLTTGTTAVTFNVWHYIEFKGTIHDTTGSYDVLLDGTSEITGASADTRNGGTGVWDNVRLNGGTSGGSTYFDDLYVCDTSGSAPRNTFLGSVKVELLMPQTDAVAVGSNTGLTPSTGTDHGALVDEIPPNTTDYNSSATVGTKDTYNYPVMALTGTVLGIQTNLYVSKSDASARSVCAVVRSASADSDGANVNPGTTFGYFSEIKAQDPNAGSPIEWTTTTVGSMQAGMKVTV